MLPIDGKQIVTPAGAGNAAPAAAEPGEPDAGGSTFGEVYSKEAPAVAPGAQAATTAEEQTEGGNNLQPDGESLPPGAQTAERGDAQSPVVADAQSPVVANAQSPVVADAVTELAQRVRPDAAPVPVDAIAAAHSQAQPLSDAGVQRPADEAAPPVSQPGPVAMPAAIAPSDTVPAVGDIEGALPPLVQPLAPGEALLPQKAQASVSGSELSLPVADLTRVGAVADPLPALPPGAADARSKPAPALRAAPIPAVVPAQDGAVLQPGNERALAPEPGLPDGLLARAADTLQPATSATPTLGQALFGVTDATGEPLLSQRLESAAPLLPRPGDRAWDGEFAGRLTMMVRNGVQEASLQLKPAELGRLEIQIATEGDQTRVHFLVQNAAAREAIEQAMPRLREMLEQSGLQLAQSDVADQSQSGGRERTYAGEQSGEPAAVDAELLTEDAPHSLHALRGRSMVDHYV